MTSTVDEIQHPKTSSSPSKTEGPQVAQNVSRPTRFEELLPSVKPSTSPVQSSKTTITPTKYDGPYPSNTITTDLGIGETKLSPDLSEPTETVPIEPTTTPKQPPEGEEYAVSIPNLNFDLDTSNASCDDIQYVCAGIYAGNVNFGLNSTSSSELVGCEQFTKCVGKLTSCFFFLFFFLVFFFIYIVTDTGI